MEYVETWWTHGAGTRLQLTIYTLYGCSLVFCQLCIIATQGCCNKLKGRAFDCFFIAYTLWMLAYHTLYTVFIHTIYNNANRSLGYCQQGVWVHSWSIWAYRGALCLCSCTKPQSQYMFSFINSGASCLAGSSQPDHVHMWTWSVSNVLITPHAFVKINVAIHTCSTLHAYICYASLQHHWEMLQCSQCKKSSCVYIDCTFVR